MISATCRVRAAPNPDPTPTPNPNPDPDPTPTPSPNPSPNALPGQPAHERSYVGIIAQELPDELVPFCRFRTSMTPAALYARMQVISN